MTGHTQHDPETRAALDALRSWVTTEQLLDQLHRQLADVTDVLSDTNLGREMHSVISQGRVETIIHSKPRERRLLVEEAAGLGKHRKRRRRAQLKLDRTGANLDRALELANAAVAAVNDRAAQVAATGALTPLTDYGITTDGYYPSIVKAGTYQDKLYGVAPGVNGLALIYNKDLLTAAGVEPPKTWDELATMAKEIGEQEGIGGGAGPGGRSAGVKAAAHSKKRPGGSGVSPHSTGHSRPE